ncbi:MAG: TonB-dependent receptor [Gemmatimonadota bacterium]
MLLRLFARPLGIVGTLFALIALAVHPAAAQTGSSVDVITGTVTDATGKPVADATIEAFSIETQVTKKTTSNDKGRYTLFFNDGTGQYRVTVRQIGKQPFIQNVSRQTDDDRIVLNIKMGEKPVVLQDITARASRQPQGGGNERPTPGSTERNISADQAAKLPIDASDLAALAALAPGVVMTAATDSSGAAFSVAGQSTSQNSFVVDGSSQGGSGSIPQDAIRGTRVITNTYDVARGQFSGGQVSATTRGGSNVKQGSVSANLQDRHLSWGAATNNVFTAGQTSQQLGGGYGGPLKKDKLFLYGAVQLNRSLNPIATLNAADATTLGRLGASPDSVARFITLADATGLTARAGVIDPNRTTNRFTGSLRFDWNAADKHTVTVRGDYNSNGSDPTRIGSTQLPQVGGNQTGSGGGLQLSVASRFSANLTNEFRIYGSSSNNQSVGFLSVPTGRVQNFSTQADGSVTASTFGFGGNTGLPQHNDSRSVEISEEISLLPAGGVHRFRLGLLANLSHFEQDVTNNRFGSYYFNSLADFANNTPASFTRTLQPTIRSGGAINSAVYLSDVLRPSQNLQLTVGGRFEHGGYTGAPARNAAVESIFGVRTDLLPSENYFTPRVGFSWTIPSGEQSGSGQRGFSPPALVVRGGAGVFRGTMPVTLPGTAQAQSGFSNTETQLSCVGGNVPAPNWNSFANDPSTIPTECIGGGSSPILTGRPSVTVYDKDYGAAKTYRSSLGITRRFWSTWALNVDASYVRGVGQSASRDLNLNETSRFTLGNEGSRPVYADPTQIIGTTGAIPLSASRINTNYGTVNEVFSKLENETKQLTTGITAFTRRGALINFNYTLMYAKDQGGAGGDFRGGFGGGGGGGGGNLTAGDPNVYEWARSSNDRRHNFQLNLTWPFNQGLEVTAIGSMVSGTPYTPVVGSDVNGDGSRNDRAYIFNPLTASDPAVSAAMSRLLSSTSSGGKACLESQLGQIAGRNSCRGPWTPQFNLQVNWRPVQFNRRLSLSFSTVNLLGGLDELVHGADNISGWGGNSRPDATLLTVKGFDASTNQFKYVVNERFGATNAASTSIRAPFQLRLVGRYTMGQAQGRDALRGGFGGRGGATGAAQGGSFATQFLTRIREAAPNVAKAALERKDSLALTKDQIAKLQAIVDSGDARITPLLTSFEAEMKKAGDNPDFAAMMPKLRPIMDAITKEQTTDRASAKAILTDVQWALLPETVRNPQQNLFGGQRQGGGGGGGGRGPDRPE